jgi:hypothetical protein
MTASVQDHRHRDHGHRDHGHRDPDHGPTDRTFRCAGMTAQTSRRLRLRNRTRQLLSRGSMTAGVRVHRHGDPWRGVHRRPHPGYGPIQRPRSHASMTRRASHRRSRDRCLGLRRRRRGGASGRQTEGSGKTVDGKTVHWLLFDVTARPASGRQQPMTSSVPQTTERAHGTTPAFHERRPCTVVLRKETYCSR